MSETWEDLGYTKERPDKPLLRIPPSPIPAWKHESEEATALRRGRNLEHIFSIQWEPKLLPSGEVIAAKKGKTFSFYPATDCYFIHSTQKYGCGIEKLCIQIVEHLGKE